MKLHRFNENGLNRFGQFLDALMGDPSFGIPGELLTHPACAEVVPPGIDIELRQFSDRMEAARYLDEILSDVTDRDIPRDAGLWAWLTLYYFDQLCPADTEGNRKLGAQRATWIPQTDIGRRFYRHALLGPYLAYRAHRDLPERGRVLLADPLRTTTSEAFRLFIETPFINMAAPVELATKFYFNSETKKLRRGAGTKGAGGLRRFLSVLQQLDLTFDIHSLSVDGLRMHLPKEFDKWAASNE
jgi:hypothetical protein